LANVLARSLKVLMRRERFSRKYAKNVKLNEYKSHELNMRESSDELISHKTKFFFGSIGFLVVVLTGVVPVVKPTGSGGGIDNINK
jgi:hypothetical protein